jgi:hypothetical protein
LAFFRDAEVLLRVAEDMALADLKRAACERVAERYWDLDANAAVSDRRRGVIGRPRR